MFINVLIPYLKEYVDYKLIFNLTWEIELSPSAWLSSLQRDWALSLCVIFVVAPCDLLLHHPRDWDFLVTPSTWSLCTSMTVILLDCGSFPSMIVACFLGGLCFFKHDYAKYASVSLQYVTASLPSMTLCPLSTWLY